MIARAARLRYDDNFFDLMHGRDGHSHLRTLLYLTADAGVSGARLRLVQTLGARAAWTCVSSCQLARCHALLISQRLHWLSAVAGSPSPRYLYGARMIQRPSPPYDRIDGHVRPNSTLVTSATARFSLGENPLAIALRIRPQVVGRRPARLALSLLILGRCNFNCVSHASFCQPTRPGFLLMHRTLYLSAQGAHAG